MVRAVREEADTDQQGVRPESATAGGAGVTRRLAVAGIGAAGAIGAVSVLAACGSDAKGNTADASAQGTGGATPSQGTGGTPSQDAGGGASADARLTTPASAIPVDGGTIFVPQQVVVTQPSAGEFKAFSAICTHKGCPVKSVKDGNIVCPCHNSLFSIADGSVISGPARSPLPALTVTVTGDEITVTG